MGGTVKVAVRLPDGEVVSDCRWTNSLSAWIRDPKLFDDATMESHLRDYLAQDSTHRNDDHTLAPVSYGLVIIDAKTRTIYAMSDYGHIDVTNLAVVMLREHDEDNEQWVALRDQGRLSVHDLKGGEEPFTLPRYPELTVFKEAARLYEEERERRPNTIYQVVIDLSPWKLVTYTQDSQGRAEFLDFLRSSDFPFGPEDEAVWAEFIEIEDL